MVWAIRLAGFFLVSVTLLPELRTGKGYVRWWDFPRLQVMLLLLAWLVAIVTTGMVNGFTIELCLWLAVGALATIWQVGFLLPFCRLSRCEVDQTTETSGGDRIRIMVANVDYENQHSQIDQVGQLLGQRRAEVLLIVEYDQKWAARLQNLRRQYMHHFEEVRGEGLGMAIWSNLRIESAEKKYIISQRRVSLWLKLETQSGRLTNFVAVHPTPPGLEDSTGDRRRDSSVRDAELISIAKTIASRKNEHWLVAGDFNDVAWSHTMRLFKRLAGLRDPRVGRVFMGTYIADYPPCRCPIDHVYVSQGFTVGALQRMRIDGSDHFAIIADIALCDDPSGVKPQKNDTDLEQARQMVDEGRKSASDRNVETESAATRLGFAAKGCYASDG